MLEKQGCDTWGSASLVNKTRTRTQILNPVVQSLQQKGKTLVPFPSLISAHTSSTETIPTANAVAQVLLEGNASQEKLCANFFDEKDRERSAKTTGGPGGRTWTSAWRRWAMASRLKSMSSCFSSSFFFVSSATVDRYCFASRSRTSSAVSWSLSGSLSSSAPRPASLPSSLCSASSSSSRPNPRPPPPPPRARFSPPPAADPGGARRFAAPAPFPLGGAILQVIACLLVHRVALSVSLPPCPPREHVKSSQSQLRNNFGIRRRAFRLKKEPLLPRSRLSPAWLGSTLTVSPHYPLPDQRHRVAAIWGKERGWEASSARDFSISRKLQF